MNTNLDKKKLKEILLFALKNWLTLKHNWNLFRLTDDVSDIDFVTPGNFKIKKEIWNVYGYYYKFEWSKVDSINTCYYNVIETLMSEDFIKAMIRWYELISNTCDKSVLKLFDALWILKSQNELLINKDKFMLLIAKHIIKWDIDKVLYWLIK